MKNLSVVFVLLCSVFSSFAQEDKVQSQVLTFEKTSHDFGKISDQQDAYVSFPFTNSSGKSIVLNPPKTSCGCTVPRYPKEPIAAGEVHKISVKYSTKGRIGRFTKDIKVYVQGYDLPVILTISGEVVSPKEVSTLPKKETNSLFK